MPLIADKRDGAIVALSIVLVVIYVIAAGGGYPLDDSWIHQTYGRNLALHGEWSFLLGEPSAASTSPLYTVLLAIGYFLRIPHMIWTHGLGTIMLAVTGLLGVRLGDRLVANCRPPHKHAGLLVGLGLVMTWHLLWAAASGMETMLFSMMSLVLIYLAWREMDDGRNSSTQSLMLRGALFGVMTALSALARPEGVVIGALAAGLMLLLRPQGSLQKVIIWGIGSALGFAIAIAPYLWLNLDLTGGLLPNTANAKFVQFAPRIALYSYPERVYKLLEAIFAGGQALLIPGILAYVYTVLKREDKRSAFYLLLPLFWAVALIAVYAYKLPFWDQHGRYVIPALPAFIVMGIVGTLWLLRSIRHLFLTRILGQVLGLSAIVLFSVFALWGSQFYRFDVAIIDAEMVTAAKWIHDNLPEDDLLAIHDIGAVGYFAPRPMVDVAGLVNPEVIDYIGDPDAMWAYLEAQGAQYFFGFPDQIPGGDPDDERLCLIYSTEAEVTLKAGHPNMALYKIAWDATCED